MTKKRGPKPKSYITDSGDTIAGLSRRPDGRFYPTGHPNVWLGTEPTEAIYRYSLWLVCVDVPSTHIPASLD